MRKKVLKEFLSRPREVHSLGLGIILSYLGLVHAPLSFVSGGYPVLTALAFGIGMMIIGVKNKEIRKYCNKALLPEKTNIPDDIKNEWAYYWLGIFIVYLSHSVYGLVF